MTDQSPANLLRFDIVKGSAAADVLLERVRQVAGKGYTPEHDDLHEKGQLALAAVCYATPIRVYKEERFATSIGFADPYPWWDSDSREYDGNTLVDPDKLSPERRREDLVKAGALILAEIERLDRAAGKS